jgi:hypothetical protein
LIGGGVGEYMSIDLFSTNQKDEVSYKSQLFDQYKLYVEMTDRISQRRTTANTFFVTANAALLTVASWFKDDFGKYMYLISVVGIIISLFWFFCIRSYKQLNSGKFKVIHEIEKALPLRLFEYEWEVLGKGKSFNKYWPLSHVECTVPFIFIGLYAALSIFNIINF